MNIDQLQQWINLELGEYASRQGHAIYSGPNTWTKGRYYLLGFNPAMDATNERLESLSKKPNNWSLYLDKCWYCGGTRGIDHHHSLKPHQKRVKEICEYLGTTPRDIFATNAIFVESKTADSLDNRNELWERCWNVHRRFLEVVDPEWIICLGNALDGSALALLKHKIAPTTSIKHIGADFRDGRYFQTDLDFPRGKKRVNVLGIPHPSRFPITEALKTAFNEIRNGWLSP